MRKLPSLGSPRLLPFALVGLASLPLIAKDEPADAKPKGPATEAAQPAAKKASAPPKAEPDDKPEPKAANKPLGPGLLRIETEPFRSQAKLSGIVVGSRETPVELNLKRWNDLTVVRVAPHGAKVKAGDMLIELETKDLARKIEDLERDLPSKELDLAAAELALDKAEKTTPLSLEKARREKMQAEQDLAHFEDKDRPMREKAAKEEVKEMEQALAYAQEELDQLRKMYEKDELTEETEEIILRRAENTVARYQWMLEQSRSRGERTLETLLPREHENLRRGLELRQIDWRAGEKTMRDGLEKQRLETLAKRREIEELRRSLDEHRGDLAALRVVAPHDGIVYYGMSQRGKWITAGLVDRKLIPGGKLAMREIVMTVVDPSKPRVVLSLTEDQLADLEPGQAGEAWAKWRPDAAYGGRLESVLPIPYHDKTFDAVFVPKVPAGAPAFLPGMTAEVEVVVRDTPEAILLPKAALTKEGRKEHVTLSDGKKVGVRTGRADGDRVEILEGLKPGAIVRVPTAKPEAKAPPKEEPKPEAKEDPKAKGETKPDEKKGEEAGKE
jgi:HlyD family secretion protein